ncbi:hypothetical protein VP01_1486g1 [Puccinia sorghi]|uniref:Uncharacterized protein n=1 Tax=Puccinia sorghi TaxID=27349 RepID=A0A0L6VJM0_9BASI|nr:hypothetical protein VP01_1486g1 [Puccinia sorghi]
MCVFTAYFNSNTNTHPQPQTLEFGRPTNYPLKSNPLSNLILRGWAPPIATLPHCKKTTYSTACNLMHSHCADCTVTVPKHLHMQKGGVWMAAWMEHAACQQLIELFLQFPKPVFKSAKDTVSSFCLCVFLNDREETTLRRLTALSTTVSKESKHGFNFLPSYKRVVVELQTNTQQVSAQYMSKLRERTCMQVPWKQTCCPIDQHFMEVKTGTPRIPFSRGLATGTIYRLFLNGIFPQALLKSGVLTKLKSPKLIALDPAMDENLCSSLSQKIDNVTHNNVIKFPCCKLPTEPVSSTNSSKLFSKKDKSFITEVKVSIQNLVDVVGNL